MSECLLVLEVEMIAFCIFYKFIGFLRSSVVLSLSFV